jgi:hypothetical protein
MKKNILQNLALIIFLFVSNHAFSQWNESQINVRFSLPEIALIDIEPSSDNSVFFSVDPALESGDEPQINKNSNESLWLNYSSSLQSSTQSRSIVAEIGQGTLPEGIVLYLEVSTFSGLGKGKVGQPTGKILLSTQPKAVLTNIGNCFTGDGINNGHVLSYSIEIADLTNLHASDESNFTILYTISDN